MKEFWTVPRFVALVVVVAAFFAFKFIATKPYTGPHNLSEAQSDALNAWGEAVVGNNGHLSMAQSVTSIRSGFESQGWSASVTAHGTDFMITFHQQPAVCIHIPVVSGSLQPAVLVSC